MSIRSYNFNINFSLNNYQNEIDAPKIHHILNSENKSITDKK